MTALGQTNGILRTERLRLVPPCHEQAAEALAGAGSLAELMGLDVPPGVARDAFDADLLRDARAALLSPEDTEWPYYYVVADLGQGPRLAGVVGYKGPLAADGSIEVGYAVRADLQGYGIATEATGALVRRALADSRVDLVIAETLPHLLSSIRVLTKLGFVQVAGASSAAVIRFERRRREGP